MCSQVWVTYLEFTDIIRPLTYLTLSNGESKQIPAATTERYKKPTGSELYGRNLCVVLFFFFFLPGKDICVFTASWRKLSVQCMLCARVRQREGRERASMWVSLSVCNVLSSWTLSWTLLPSEEDDSRISETKRGTVFSLVLLFLLFWMFASKDVLLRHPWGFWTLF